MCKRLMYALSLIHAFTQDFTNLKMPDGNVEPLISPKLAVAMESVSHFNSAIFFFLLQATLLDGAW